MKKLVSICFVLLFIALTPIDAKVKKEVKTPEVEKLDCGWYKQNFLKAGANLTYYVDTNAKLCFILSPSGMAVIDSNKLKNREEWKDIITW